MCAFTARREQLDSVCVDQDLGSEECFCGLYILPKATASKILESATGATVSRLPMESNTSKRDIPMPSAVGSHLEYKGRTSKGAGAVAAHIYHVMPRRDAADKGIDCVSAVAGRAPRPPVRRTTVPNKDIAPVVILKKKNVSVGQLRRDMLLPREQTLIMETRV